MAERTDRKYILEKIVIAGESVPGAAGAVGPSGPAGASVSSALIHDGNERNGVDAATLLDELLYLFIAINTFVNQSNNQEKGVTLTSVVFNWTLNKANITSQQISGSDIVPTSIPTANRAFTASPVAISTNATWTLEVDDGTNIITKVTSINFYNKIHWGARVTGVFNDAFILGLSGAELRANKNKTFNVNAGASDHIYFILPTAYGVPTFTVGGFSGGFTKVSTISHTNASGHIENYDIWESDNVNLGDTNVTVS